MKARNDPKQTVTNLLKLAKAVVPQLEGKEEVIAAKAAEAEAKKAEAAKELAEKAVTNKEKEIETLAAEIADADNSVRCTGNHVPQANNNAIELAEKAKEAEAVMDEANRVLKLLSDIAAHKAMLADVKKQVVDEQAAADIKLVEEKAAEARANSILKEAEAELAEAELAEAEAELAQINSEEIEAKKGLTKRAGEKVKEAAKNAKDAKFNVEKVELEIEANKAKATFMLFVVKEAEANNTEVIESKQALAKSASEYKKKAKDAEDRLAKLIAEAEEKKAEVVLAEAKSVTINTEVIESKQALAKSARDKAREAAEDVEAAEVRVKKVIEVVNADRAREAAEEAEADEVAKEKEAELQEKISRFEEPLAKAKAGFEEATSKANKAFEAVKEAENYVAGIIARANELKAKQVVESQALEEAKGAKDKATEEAEKAAATAREAAEEEIVVLYNAGLELLKETWSSDAFIMGALVNPVQEIIVQMAEKLLEDGFNSFEKLRDNNEHCQSLLKQAYFNKYVQPAISGSAEFNLTPEVEKEIEQLSPEYKELIKNTELVPEDVYEFLNPSPQVLNHFYPIQDALGVKYLDNIITAINILKLTDSKLKDLSVSELLSEVSLAQIQEEQPQQDQGDTALVQPEGLTGALETEILITASESEVPTLGDTTSGNAFTLG